MLRSLKSVAAPANFEFGVKAKIAQGAPKLQQTGGLSRLVRYALPFAFVLIIGAVLVLNSLYFVGERSVADIPAVTEQKIELPAQPIENKELTSTSNSGEVAATQPPVAPPAPKPFVKAKTITVQQKRADTPSGGSYDAAQRIQEPIYPKSSNTLQKSEIAAKDALGSLGIDATFDGTHWKVTSVKEKSVAEHVGIKAGDQPEAVDDQRLSGTTSFKKPLKTITVMRDGKPIKIVLP
jgi:hypothetical protein